jgi:hypothetical protein
MAKASRDIGASVRARLLNLARERGQVLDLLLTRYALERLLYRLSLSAHRNRFVLKGAMLDSPSRFLRTGVAIGSRRATGLPAFVIMISAPATTSFNSCEMNLRFVNVDSCHRKVAFLGHAESRCAGS